MFGKFISLTMGLFLFSNLIALQAEASGEGSATKYQWTNFQVGGISTWQGYGQSGGGVIRYLPSYSWNEEWTLGISFDAAYLKLNTNVSFAGIGYMGFLKRKVSDRWALQLNAGAQTWTCDGCETKPVFGPTISYNVTSEKLSWIKDLWLAYLPVFHDETAHEVQLGVGIRF